MNEFKGCLRSFPVFFLKGALDCCARSVTRITVKDGSFYAHQRVCDIEALIKNEPIVICQEPVSQHEALARLNPTSVNTIRIITVRSPSGEIVLPFEPLLRVGASDAAVDNWASGGLVVRIDGGRLDAHGYYKATLPKERYCVTRHPVSDVIFAGYEIPYYHEAVDLVKRAHVFLGDLFIIGWDVAITPTGPILIEGNDDPELTLHQIVCRRGLRSELLKHLEKGKQ